MAQSSPLLRPHRLPLFTRRLNEAAGAAEMNQSPAWAWEGRRTGSPPWRLGGRPASSGWYSDAIPCGEREYQSCHPRGCPHPFPLLTLEETLLTLPGRGPAGAGSGVHWLWAETHMMVLAKVWLVLGLILSLRQVLSLTLSYREAVQLGL